MARLDDLFDRALFEAAVADGLVAVKRHPTAPLRICDYTAKAQYSRTWNPVTLACRGLIIGDDDTVVARPFTKFFNLSEHDPATVPVGEAFEVFDKMDGSLGITYREAPGGPIALSTRGSFISEQAQHATAVWRARYAEVDVPEGQTWLLEIVYPTNRIVVDYRGLDDLVLLAVLDVETGRDLPLPGADVWPGPVVRHWPGVTALDQLPVVDEAATGDFEGFVVRFASGLRVKVKAEEYVRLHRIVTGVSNITLWEHLRDGLGIDELLDRVPDEFYDWVRATVAALQADHDAIVASCRATLADPRVDPADRKATALFLQTQPNPGICFRLLDGKDASEGIWRLLRPVHAKPFRVDDGS